jgi:hypothetical protein
MVVAVTRPLTPTRPRPSAGVLAVLAGLALAFVAVLLGPGGSPPLYNGLGFPDEPYRWVDPPAGAPATDRWTPAGGTIAVTDGKSASGSFTSKEQGPQVAYFADPEAFVVPAGTTSVEVDAQGVSVPGPLPQGTTAVSNVYAFTATPVGGTGPVTFAEGRKYLVNLRADTATDRVVLLHRWVGDRWEQRATFQVGTDVYAGTITAFGQYVLLKMAPGAAISVQHSEPSPLPRTSGAPGSPSRSGASPGPAGSASPGGPDAEAAGVVPGRVADEAGVSDATLWWAVGGLALLLAAGLVVLRVLIARRSSGPPPP